MYSYHFLYTNLAIIKRLDYFSDETKFYELCNTLYYYLVLQDFLNPLPSTAQCDDFAKSILEIVRTASYEKLPHYFAPKEAKR